MLARFFMIFAVMVLVTACSTTDEAVMDEQGGAVAQQGGVGNGALDDVYGGQGAAPGTQADLVANVGDRIFFGYDSSELSGEARSTLDKQAAWLNQYSNLSITVEGHADERGTREYNLALGERRANAVKNYLVALGVSPSRLNVISYGKERPAVPGDGETSFAQNRRSVTVVN